jgi:hypothetical protein
MGTYPSIGTSFDHFNDKVAGGDMPWTDMDFRSNNQTLYSRSLSGRVQTRSFSTQYFSWKAVFTPLTHTEFKPVYAFIHGKAGRFAPYTITIPGLAHEGTITTGTATGTIGSRTLTVAATGTLKAGDLISFNNTSGEHYKVYMVTDDATLSGSGTVNIFPGLINAETTQTFYTGQDIKFLARSVNDVQTYNLSTDGFYRFEIDMEETF